MHGMVLLKLDYWVNASWVRLQKKPKRIKGQNCLPTLKCTTTINSQFQRTAKFAYGCMNNLSNDESNETNENDFFPFDNKTKHGS